VNSVVVVYFSPEKTISNRAKREIPDDSEYKFIVEQGNQSTSVSTLATPSSSTNDITMSPAAEEPPKPVIVVPSKSVVSANKTSVLLFNLEPNMAYSIEVCVYHYIYIYIYIYKMVYSLPLKRAQCSAEQNK